MFHFFGLFLSKYFCITIITHTGIFKSEVSGGKKLIIKLAILYNTAINFNKTKKHRTLSNEVF